MLGDEFIIHCLQTKSITLIIHNIKYCIARVEYHFQCISVQSIIFLGLIGTVDTFRFADC